MTCASESPQSGAVESKGAPLFPGSDRPGSTDAAPASGAAVALDDPSAVAAIERALSGISQ